MVKDFQAEYDGMVAYFINGEITKETYKKGIQVDINNWAPHYAVYLVWDHWERVADGINRNKAYKKIE